ARTQRDTTAVADEVRQCVLGGDVHRLRIGGGVAEGLHHEVGGEAQAGEVFQLVASHWTSGVLRTHGGHLRLAVGARTYAVNATGTTHDFLRQRVAFAVVGRGYWATEYR